MVFAGKEFLRKRGTSNVEIELYELQYNHFVNNDTNSCLDLG